MQLSREARPFRAKHLHGRECYSTGEASAAAADSVGKEGLGGQRWG